jgi:ribosomal protein S18 acetylase RimI-like enzyme
MKARAAVTVVEAATDADAAEVTRCLGEFLAWMRIRYADQIWIVDKYFDPRQWQRELESPREAYPLPAAAMLLAKVEGRTAGCVMLRDLGGRICEMKRMYVRPEFQGRGVGRALGRSLLALAAVRGYSSMRLDTGPLQPEAQALYRGLGFREIDCYYDCPDDLRRSLLFMEQRLA